MKKQDEMKGRNVDKTKEDGDELSGANQLAETMRCGLDSISKDIHDLRADMNSLKEQITEDVKMEIKELKQEIYQQLATNNKTLQTHKAQIAEAEERIADMETCSVEVKEALSKSLKQQKILRERLTDIKVRSKRNNIRIFGIPEDEEKSSATDYVTKLLMEKLSRPPETNLKIQRAHRALTQKPKRNAPPRSIIANFLKFTTKERVLKAAWQKKIEVAGRRLIFDHDYPTEVVQKRKAYSGIKKALKEKGVRFQTPFTKLRIHWDAAASWISMATARRKKRKWSSFKNSDELRLELYK